MDQIKEEYGESIDMEHVADSALDEIEPGSIITGEVVSVNGEYVYVSIGAKSDGRVPLDEFKNQPSVGEKLEVKLQGTRLVDGVFQLSVKAAAQEKQWKTFMEKHPDGTGTIEGRVVSAINKGKLVDCNGFTAFLPFSLSADLKGVSSTDHEYSFVIRSIDKRKKSVLISRVEIVEEEMSQKWASFVEKYSEGSRVQGQVMKFVEFGAFVRVDGIDALLHRNDMSWKNVFNQRKILKLNETREFVILSINNETKKVSIGLKQLTSDPWENIESRLSQGSRVKGTVVNIINSGAFVELDEEVEGFVPNTELSWTKTSVPAKDVFQKSQEVELVVLSINKNEKRLQLGYRQTLDNPWETIDQRFPVGSVHKKAIRKVVSFGLFVELEPGIDGLVHVSDITWEDGRKNPEELFKAGEEVEFKVLEIRKNEMKISCGIKQLEKSPWQTVAEKYKPRTKVSGTVSGITKFGIFVKLEEKLEGMVHISEASKSRVEDLSEIFKEGDAVEAVVIGVDIKKKKISLSIKQLDIQSEKEEINKLLNETKPGAFTIGDMVNLKLGE